VNTTEYGTAPVNNGALWQLGLTWDVEGGAEPPVCDRSAAAAALTALAGRPVGAEPDGEQGARWGVWLGSLYGEHAASAEAALEADPTEDGAPEPPVWSVTLADGRRVWIAVIL